MAKKTTYEELEQRVKELEKEVVEHKLLEESVNLLSTAVKTNVDAISVASPVDGKLIYCNESFLKWWKVKGDYTNLTYHECFDVDENVLEKAAQATMIGSWSGELRAKAMDGQTFPVLVTSSPVKDKDGKTIGLLGTFKAITELKRAQEALRTYHEKLESLASELSLAEERQRRRVAIEVHDRISQNLAFVKMKLGTLRASTASSSLAGAMEEMLSLVDETIQNTRALISELGSPVLCELGFVPAVEWLTQQTQKQHGIVLAFEDDGQPKPLSEDVRVLLFQAVRELLVNIAKHAQARTAKVSITRSGDQVRVDVGDDGVGFDTPGWDLLS